MKQIDDLFGRAKAHKITLRALAKEAELHPSTFQLWKKGTSPTMKAFGAADSALDRLIARKRDKAHPPGI